MLRTFLLLVFLFVGTAFLPVAELYAADVPTQIIPADQFDDQFDRDFEEIDIACVEGCVDDILIDDPLEGFNRKIFWANDKLYFYLFKPVARGYRLVLPRPARASVDNVFSNISTPVRAINALLQLKFYACGTELYRFVVNTTVGLGGLFDVAGSTVGIEVIDEDFGQTLGVYGAGHGFYLVLPVLGPSSLRDAGGKVVDSFADPIRYTDLSDLEYLGVKVFKAINTLSLDPDTYEGIVRDSLDPYLFVRAAYSQRRALEIGKVEHDILSTDGMFLDDETSPLQNLLGL